MPDRKRPDQLREALNPLFNERKLKLGTFSSNLSQDCAISNIEGCRAAGKSDPRDDGSRYWRPVRMVEYLFEACQRRYRT